MDLKEIRQLVKLVETSEISELQVEQKDNKIKIVKNGPVAQLVQATAPPVAAMPAAPASAAAGESVSAAPPKADNVLEIKSPMVGTFYRAASPDSASYTDIGKNVKAGDVLCIVEAMKLMNEIESEFSGKVIEILVDNGQPVEYNQVLFLIEKA